MRLCSIYTLLLALAPLSSYSSSQAVDPWKAAEYSQNSTSQKNAAEDLMKQVEIKKNGTILDVGCGDGKITAEISKKVPQGSVIGVDISPAMIEFATEKFPREQFPNLQFLIEDAQHLNFENQFDILFSFTTLHWIQNHDAFLKNAFRSLKPAGMLAVTMPMGLPKTLQQAVTERLSLPQWAPYFHNFSTGWNFTNEAEYRDLLAINQFIPIRLAVIPQRDIFPSRASFENFIAQWFPYLRPLEEPLKTAFLKEVVDRFLELETSYPNGDIHFKIRRLEVIAIKASHLKIALDLIKN